MGNRGGGIIATSAMAGRASKRKKSTDRVAGASRQTTLDKYLAPLPTSGSAAAPGPATRQVARKRTSHPPAARAQQTAPDSGTASVPGPSTRTPAAASGAAEADVIHLRIKKGRPHPQIEYEYNMLELGAVLAKGPEDTVKFAQRHGLLLPERPCNVCMEACGLEYRQQGNPRWFCRRHEPRFQQTITAKTVFERSHVPMDKLLMLFYMFGHGITEYRHLQRELSARPEVEEPTPGRAVEEPGAQRAAASRRRAKWIRTSSATIRQWLLFCREICFVFLDKKFEQEGRIGGNGVVVEIDESKFGKMKHHVGRRVDGQWILGMIEINTGEEGEKRRGGRFRLEICPDNRRDEPTLRALIQKHVLPGTTLVTDGWKAYCNIWQYDYELYTVVHEHNFVDPSTGANTQTIESNWRSVKRKLLRGGLKRDELALHLCEFLWRRYVQCSERDPFVEFLEAAALAYDPADVLPGPESDSEHTD